MSSSYSYRHWRIQGGGVGAQKPPPPNACGSYPCFFLPPATENLDPPLHTGIKFDIG